MEVWVGPAIIAALVSALVSAAGWFVSSWQALRLDERRRAEKVNDVQVALLSEIRNVVFESIVKDIPVLPARVITPVIHYARMRQTLDQFIGDMRSPSFAKLAALRQLIMYGDYLEMQARLETLAEDAIAALDISLSSSDEDLPIPRSASGAGGASAERSASP